MTEPLKYEFELLKLRVERQERLLASYRERMANRMAYIEKLWEREKVLRRENTELKQKLDFSILELNREDIINNLALGDHLSFDDPQVLAILTDAVLKKLAILVWDDSLSDAYTESLQKQFKEGSLADLHKRLLALIPEEEEEED